MNEQPRNRPRSATPRIGGVVLAAGASSRMGRNKLLLDVGGEALIRRMVRTALSARLDPVLVVLGHEADEVRSAVGGLPCACVENPRYAEGMNGSVCAGLAALPSSVAAGVVLLGDMPFVSAFMIESLVARHAKGDCLLVVSDYGGITAPPTLVDRSLFDEMRSAAGKGCAKRLRKRHESETAALAWPASKLADLDVPSDYERVSAQLTAT